MKRLYACCYHTGIWGVSSDRINNHPRIVGIGKSLPAAYLDYLHNLEKEIAQNKADKAKEQLCIDAIIAMQNKPKQKPDRFERAVVQVIAEPEPSKTWWQFWK